VIGPIGRMVTTGVPFGESPGSLLARKSQKEGPPRHKTPYSLGVSE
jgi:hypothetical protein